MTDLATPNGLPITITSKMLAPKGAGNLYVWSISIQFPDGMRSAVVLGRLTMPAKGSPGWHACLTVADSQGGAVAGTPTAAHFDQRMAAGDVLFWFMHSGDKNYARGIWSRDATQCSAAEVNSFAWGMSQLAGTIQAQTSSPSPSPPPSPVQQSSGVAVPVASGGGPIVQMQPQPIIVTPAPAPRRWPYYVAALAAVGIVGYVVLD
jgi:hypothetical protein